MAPYPTDPVDALYVRTFVTVPEVRADRVTAELTTRELTVAVPVTVALLETTSALVVSVPVV
jgi:hypothetical protein